MAKNYLITGLDIGTQSIKVLVTRKETEGLEVLTFKEIPASGIRRGVVVNVEEVSQMLKEVFLKIKEDTGQRIDSVYLNVAGAHLFSMPSHGTIAVSRADQKISEGDIHRVLEAAQAFSLPSNKEIFQVLPREFIIDGQRGIKQALGLEGVRLEAKVLILGGFSPYLKNLTQTVLNANLQALDIIPSALAAARSTLTEKQKELGVALLDIGAGTSNLAVFEERDLIHFAVFPFGSANITNDIAIGLKIDIDIAERIKIEFGTCLLGNGQKKEKIKLNNQQPLVFSQKQLTGIIGTRVSEIFSEIQKELKKIGKEKLLPAGIVLTGGGSKLPKMMDLAKKKFQLPSKLGKSQTIRGLEEDLSLATVSGLVLSGADLERESKSFGLQEEIGSKIKKFFKIFIP